MRKVDTTEHPATANPQLASKPLCDATLKQEWQAVSSSVLPRRDGMLFSILMPAGWILLREFGVPVPAAQIGWGALVTIAAYYLPPKPSVSFRRWTALVLTLWGSLGVAFWWLPQLLGTTLPWYLAYGLSMLALFLWLRYTPTAKEFRRLSATPEMTEQQAVERAREVAAAAQRWIWTEPTAAVRREPWFGGDAEWEVVSDAGGSKAQVRVIVNARTGKVTFKHYISG